MLTDQLYVIREDTDSNIHLLNFINENIEPINTLLETKIKVFTVDKKMLNDVKYLEALRQSNIKNLPALISSRGSSSIEQTQNIIGYYINKFKEVEEQSNKIKNQPPKELGYDDLIQSEIIGHGTDGNGDVDDNELEETPLDMSKVNMPSRANSNNSAGPHPPPQSSSQSNPSGINSNMPKPRMPAKVEKIDAEDEQLLEKLGCNMNDDL